MKEQRFSLSLIAGLITALFLLVLIIFFILIV